MWLVLVAMRGLWPLAVVETRALWGLWPKVPPQTNAAKDSQTGQTIPLQGWIAGTTQSRVVA